MNESLRLVMPWLRTKLGWWAVQYDEDGTPTALVPDCSYDRSYFDERAMQLVEPPRDQQAVEDWLQAWPGQHFWRPDDDEPPPGTGRAD